MSRFVIIIIMYNCLSSFIFLYYHVFCFDLIEMWYSHCLTSSIGCVGLAMGITVMSLYAVTDVLVVNLLF